MLLRSMLFAPGNDARKLERSLQTVADAVIFDLEDSVPASAKEAARRLAATFLASRSEAGSGPLRLVRVNAVNTGLIAADVQAVARPGLGGIVLAKAETPGEVAQLDVILAGCEAAAGLAVGETGVFPLIETARGVANARVIAEASPRIRCLLLGAADLSRDLGINLTREGHELAYTRGKLVIDSRAAGVGRPVDSVYEAFRDLEGLAIEAQRSRSLGFQGKLVVHPGQVGPVHEAFRPTEAEVAWAKQVVMAFREAEAAGLGVIQVESYLVDRPMVDRATWVLTVAGLDASGVAR